MTREQTFENHFTVNYDVLLSQSYRVPVLYFTLLDATEKPIRDLDRVYKLLVPAAYKSQLRDVGVIGGISVAVSCCQATTLSFV